MAVWSSFRREKLLSRTAKTEAIIRFQPVKGCGLFWIQPEAVTLLDEVSALLRIFHQAVGFLVIRPVLDFRRRLRRAIGQEPGADLIIILRDLDCGCELFAGDALEAEELVIQRAIVVVFARRAGQTGAAFIHRPAGDGESADAFARTVRRLLG